ncbi:MAG: histidinol-phosphate aminotransferase family protein [Desulfovibrionaceae bacterium]|nr:histidinol-phosphate aminotransferase family protein [Desulfovibrionaceae bacterium]MBF0512646.1 histidinol-phosphate aminotransferase family protein [Desulfovibrionaceae bacterium]
MIQPREHLQRHERLATEVSGRAGMLRLDLNENPEGLPGDFLQRALAGITPELLASYPNYAGLTQRIAAIEGLPEDHVLPANGSDSAIRLVYEGYLDPGDEVVYPHPTFGMYAVYLGQYQASGVAAPFPDDFAYPTRELTAAVTARTRLLAIVSPSSPTGSVIEADDMARLLDHAAALGVLTVVDEAYHPYWPQTVAPLVRSMDNLLVLRTFSKLYGLAGLRLGYVLGQPSALRALRAVQPTFDVNALAAHVACRLLDEPQTMSAMLESFHQGKRFLTERLSGAGLAFTPIRGNFTLIRLGERAQDTALALRERGVLVKSGFGHPLLRGHIRVSVGGQASMRRFWEAFTQCPLCLE